MIPPIETAPALLALTAVLAYQLGSVPFGIVVTRAMGLGDLRQIGSGNIGATNVLRTGNRLAAALTLILDAGKGRPRGAGGARGASRGCRADWRLRRLLRALLPGLPALPGRQGSSDVLRHDLGAIVARGAGRLRHLGTGRGDHAHLIVVRAGSRCTEPPLRRGALLLGRADAAALLALLAALIFLRHRRRHPQADRGGPEPRIGKKSKA